MGQFWIVMAACTERRREGFLKGRPSEVVRVCVCACFEVSNSRSNITRKRRNDSIPWAAFRLIPFAAFWPFVCSAPSISFFQDTDRFFVMRQNMSIMYGLLKSIKIECQRSRARLISRHCCKGNAPLKHIEIILPVSLPAAEDEADESIYQANRDLLLSHA